MNKFFRSIGFAEPMSAAGLQHLINEVIMSPQFRGFTSNGDETLLAEFRTDFGPDMGISVVGEYGSDELFRYEYCYPYLESSRVSTVNTISVEPRIREESYAGIVDDLKVGVTLIFHLQNMIDYLKAKAGNIEPSGRSCCLAALSNEGTILLPISKTQEERRSAKKNSIERVRLIRNAMDGDENAVQSLTMQDMDTYAAISREIQTEDVYSIVDNYFAPCGVECDMYSVLGEIQGAKMVQNRITDERVWQMVVDCNGLTFTVAINEGDLYGEPAPGRRFKGIIWMQGQVDFHA